MNTSLRKFSLSACALAVSALLAACGGGTAEPPPETVPPTLTITDSEAGDTATGPVTFTFTFSEDVGTSFTAEDVLVIGGTAGTLTKVSATVYTMVVTPTAGASGTISVSVAAGKFADIALNENTASASATQAYGSGSTSTALISWDEAEGSAPFTELGAYGDASLVVEAAPTGSSGKALKITRSSAQNFGGVYAVLGSKLPFTSTNKTITAKVYASRAGAVINFKVEVPGGTSVEVPATVTAANTWQTLTWDFSAVNTANNYTVIAISPDTDVSIGSAQTYWIDDITVTATSGGGGGGGGGGGSVACGTTAPTCAPTTSIPGGSTVIYSDAASVATLNMAPDWGQPNVTRTEETIASNKSQKYVFGGAPFLYQGIDWSGSPQNVSGKATLHLDVWTADVAEVKVSVIGGGGENPVTKTLTAGSWNSLDIPLSQYTSPDLTQVIQLKLEPVSAGTLYVDNVYFHGTASGGGGGGGTFTGGIFAADYQGNLAAGTAQSTLGGSVGFFQDPRLYANKAFEDGGVCGSVCNPGGVFNFYYGIGKLLPALTDAYFGAYVNAPGNGSADASSFAKVKLKFWGDAESWEKNNFTAQVDVILQGPTNGACSNPSGRPEITRTVAAQKIGAGSEYVIPKTDFTITESCGGAYTVNSVWSAVGAVVVRLAGTNLQYVNTVPSDPVSYPTFINVGPISFIN